MSHIILEGLDRTGKTTLAQHLSKELKMPIKKFSAPTINPFGEYCEFVLHETTPHIIDRCYLSEIAYGPVKRGGSYIKALDQKIFEILCLYKGVKGIYCSDNKESIETRFKLVGESYITPDEIKPIQINYDLAIERSLLPWIPYTIGDSYNELIKRLV